MKPDELKSIAFDMRKLGYTYEQIAEYLSTQTNKPVTARYAKLMVNAIIKREMI